MVRNHIRTLILISVLCTGIARASEGWARLRLGMSASETVAAIGHPLMRSSGKNFEVWIYDQRAEVVFYGGPVVAWTSPATRNAPARNVDIWQGNAGGDGPMFVLPPAPRQILVPRWREDQYVPFYRFDRRR